MNQMNPYTQSFQNAPSPQFQPKKSDSGVKRFFKAILSAALYVLIFVAAQFVVAFAVMLGLSAVMFTVGGFSVDGLGQLMSGDIVMAVSLLSNLFALLIIFLLFAVRRRKFSAECGLHKLSPATFFGMLALGVGLNVVVSMVLSIIPFPSDWVEGYEQASAVTASNPVLYVAAAVFIAPFVEEIVFRGLAYTRLKRGMPAVIAALLSALVFGAMHGQVIWMLYTAFLGLIFVLVFERTGSLWGSIALHFAFNLTGSISGIPGLKLPALSGSAYAVVFAVALVLTGVGLISLILAKKEDNAEE